MRRALCLSGLGWLGMSLSVAADKALVPVPPGSQATVSPVFTGSYAWLCGIQDYRYADDLPAVPGEMARLQTTLEGLGYTVEHCETPDGRPATASKPLQESLKRFVDRYGHTPTHRLLFAFSGHGYTWTDPYEITRGYLVPADVPLPASKTDPGEGFLKGAIDMEWMVAMAKHMTARHALFVFDSCFSGSVLEATKAMQVPKPVQEAYDGMVRLFLTAGNEAQRVPGKSQFMDALIAGLTTKSQEADGYPAGGDGYVTGTELHQFIKPRVSKSSPQMGQIEDQPLRYRGDYVFEVGPRPQGATPPPPAPPSG